MRVESRCEGVLVRLRSISGDRLRGKPCGDERLVDAVARQRIDEPRRVADEQRSAARRARTAQPHRESVAPNVGERGRIKAVRARQPVEVGAESRALGRPASDTEVGVVSLREHPAVPSGHDAELHPGGVSIRLGIERPPRDVPLERDAADDPMAEPDRAGDDAVRSVGSDEVVGAHGRAVDPCVDAFVVGHEILDAYAVPKVRSQCGSLFGEVEVEPAALGHPDERSSASTPKRMAIARAQHEPVDDVLDDRLDVAGDVPQCAAREPAPAGLVARKSRSVDEEDACS